MFLFGNTITDVLIGHRVIATARQMRSMVELSDLGLECYELDVTDENAIFRLKNVLVNVLDGKLDILVNNAYVFITFPCCYRD